MKIKKKSITAKPVYDDNGDWNIILTGKEKYVKVPVEYFKELEKDSARLQTLKDILNED